MYLHSPLCGLHFAHLQPARQAYHKCRIFLIKSASPLPYKAGLLQRKTLVTLFRKQNLTMRLQPISPSLLHKQHVSFFFHGGSCHHPSPADHHELKNMCESSLSLLKMAQSHAHELQTYDTFPASASAADVFLPTADYIPSLPL